jgi:hypothetical protein
MTTRKSTDARRLIPEYVEGPRRATLAEIHRSLAVYRGLV